jgi:hypothetical protein
LAPPTQIELVVKTQSQVMQFNPLPKPQVPTITMNGTPIPSPKNPPYYPTGYQLVVINAASDYTNPASILSNQYIQLYPQQGTNWWGTTYQYLYANLLAQTLRYGNPNQQLFILASFGLDNNMPGVLFPIDVTRLRIHWARPNARAYPFILMTIPLVNGVNPLHASSALSVNEGIDGLRLGEISSQADISSLKSPGPGLGGEKGAYGAGPTVTETAPSGCEVPSYMSPGYSAPEIQAPNYQAPSFAAPTYTAPVYKAPQYQAPNYQAPTSLPSFNAPSYSAPSYPAPIYHAPIYQAPVYQAPTFPAPVCEVPSYQGPNVMIPSLQAPVCGVSIYQQGPSLKAPQFRGQ